MKKLWNKMKEQPDKWIFWILLIAFLGSMLPVWYLSRYIVPGCDDYTYGVRTHAAWLDTHSLWEVIKAAAATTVEYWHQWQGTYASIFLMTLSPGIGHEKWYFLTTFLMTGMLGVSICTLVWVVLKKYVCGALREDTLRVGKKTSGMPVQRPAGAGFSIGICVIVLLFLSFQTMVAPADGLYWYNGALHYVFMESVLFFQMAALLSCRKARTKGVRGGLLVLTCLLAFVLGGANLISGLQSCILTGLLFGYSLFFFALSGKVSGGASTPASQGETAGEVPASALRGKAVKEASASRQKTAAGGLWQDVLERARRSGAAEKKQLWVAFPLLVNLIGFGFNVLAPGNTIRETTAEGMGAIKAIVMSFYWAAVFLTEWMTPIALAGFVLLLPVIWRLVKKSGADFFHPAVSLLLSYCVFAAMFTPTLYATSSEGPDRCKNVMRVALYLIVFFNLVNGLGWAAQKKPDSLPVRLAEAADQKYLFCLIGGMLWMGMLFVLPANKNTYTSVSAVRSLANGEAKQYYEENALRLSLYNDETIPDVTIHYLQAKPYLLFKADVGNEGSQDYWINISIVDYYGKNSLTIIE